MCRICGLPRKARSYAVARNFRVEVIHAILINNPLRVVSLIGFVAHKFVGSPARAAGCKSLTLTLTLITNH